MSNPSYNNSLPSCGVVSSIDTPCTDYGICFQCPDYYPFPTSVTVNGNETQEVSICLNGTTYYYYGLENGTTPVFYAIVFYAAQMIAVQGMPSLNDTMQFFMSWLFYDCGIGNIQNGTLYNTIQVSLPPGPITISGITYNLASNGYCLLQQCLFNQYSVYGNQYPSPPSAQEVASLYSGTGVLGTTFFINEASSTCSGSQYPTTLPCS